MTQINNKWLIIELETHMHALKPMHHRLGIPSQRSVVDVADCHIPVSSCAESAYCMEILNVV